MEDIVSEAQDIVEKYGVKELNIVAQDITRYHLLLNKQRTRTYQTYSFLQTHIKFYNLLHSHLGNLQ